MQLDTVEVEDVIDDDIDFDEDDDDMQAIGSKRRHTSGIMGVITGASGGYYWFTHSGGQEAFIHCGELAAYAPAVYPNYPKQYGKPTEAELEEYLGHSNGFSEDKKVASG